MKQFNLEYFQKANDWNIKYRDELKEKELHCRGNLNSVSLISLNSQTPERGFSNIKSENILKDRIKKADKLKAPERKTGEKLLQARIINEAIYKNKHYLPFGNKIKFVTSEFAIKDDNSKVVNDILGFSDTGEFYIIELKSLRSKTELEAQVDSFESFIKSNKDLFYDVLKIYGFNWDKNTETTKKAIVWNKLNDKKIMRDDILEFVYDKELLENNNILKIEELL